MSAKKNTIEHLKKRICVDQSTGCWIWTGSLNKTGYAIGQFDSKTRLLHRVFYANKFGGIEPQEPLDHKCRNRACVNPDHLEQVTVTENTRRGRAARLNKALVQKMREIYLTTSITQRQLASMFSVHIVTVNDILRGKTWREGLDTSILAACYRNRAARANIKIANEQVAEIRARYRAGEANQKQLAQEFGIGAPYVSRIVNGKSRNEEF